MPNEATSEQNDKIWGMIKDIKVAMLTSEDGAHLRSRPMVASQKEFSGTLWFFTRVHSHKVVEVDQDSRVNVSYADADGQNYVSLSGTATLVRDRAAIDTHWSEILRTWFAKGKDDPETALLRVDAQQAEYWDAPSSAMVHAYGYVKAALTGVSPQPGDNQKVSYT